MLDDWDNGKLKFTPTCSRSMYAVQLEAMEAYKAVLEERAKIERVEL